MSQGPPAWITRYYGIPFEDLGRDWRSCDCYGAGRLVMLEEKDIQLPMLLDYDDAQNGAATGPLIQAEISGAAWRVAQGDPQALDWLILRRAGQTGPFHFHLAVVVDRDWVFHTYRGGTTRCERADSMALRLRGSLMGRYRHEALSEAR